MSKVPLSVEALTPLAKSIAGVCKRYFDDNKLDTGDILGLVLKDGLQIKEAVSGGKNIGPEFFDLDTDEGQFLSALVREEMGEVADKTKADEIIGEVFQFVPTVRNAFTGIKEEALWEEKGRAIGQVLIHFGRIKDTIFPPKTAAAIEEGGASA